jgi:kynurenine formamidase
MTSRALFGMLVAAISIAASLDAGAQNRPPWPRDDEIGMANTLGPETWRRCAEQLGSPRAKSYELSHVRSATMPQSPFGVRLQFKYPPTRGVRNSRHASNIDEETGQPGGQGTQMDALGHFAVMPNVWDGTSEFSSEGATYYNGFTQPQVKPTPDSPLLKLGIDKVPPIISTAVLLDAKIYLGNGQPMKPGQLVTARDIETMLERQGLQSRGLLPGDVLYIYTGWGENWKDPDIEKFYYTMGPGLSYDGAKYIEQKAVVLVALDNPFTDPVNEGQLRGAAPPAAGTPPGFPFAIHHHNLTQSGIYQIQNANLTELARDGVWISCTMILPLRTKGGAGSPVRPVAFGEPRK